MLDAVVGAVIMLIATTSLLSAVEVIETVFAQAGRQQLSVPEEQLLERIGKSDDEQECTVSGGCKGSRQWSRTWAT